MDGDRNIEESLKQLDLFEGILEENYADILSAGSRKKLSPKGILFHQGDRAEKCYFILNGRLKLAKLNEFGKEVIIRYVGPGELTAAIAVLKEEAYPVTAEVISEA